MEIKQDCVLLPRSKNVIENDIVSIVANFKKWFECRGRLTSSLLNVLKKLYSSSDLTQIFKQDVYYFRGPMVFIKAKNNRSRVTYGNHLIYGLQTDFF